MADIHMKLLSDWCTLLCLGFKGDRDFEMEHKGIEDRKEDSSEKR